MHKSHPACDAAQRSQVWAATQTAYPLLQQLLLVSVLQQLLLFALRRMQLCALKYGPHRLLREMQFTGYSAASTVSKISNFEDSRDSQ